MRKGETRISLAKCCSGEVSPHQSRRFNSRFFFFPLLKRGLPALIKRPSAFRSGGRGSGLDIGSESSERARVCRVGLARANLPFLSVAPVNFRPGDWIDFAGVEKQEKRVGGGDGEGWCWR